MAHIQDYVNGVERDLNHITPHEGHPHIKQSIMLQVRRLADIAEHNQKYLRPIAEDILELSVEKSVNRPLGINDTDDKFISISDLKLILQEAFELKESL